MEWKNLTLMEFTAATAGRTPTPGGGSVAALVGALAAALAEMVAQLTVEKDGCQEARGDMEALIPRAQALRLRLLDEIARDSAAFQGYLDALALPKGGEEERETRRHAMQEALKKAALIPLEAAETAAEILPLAEVAVRLGNPNAVSDGLVSAMLARAAVRSALLNVKTNLGSIRDEGFTSGLRARVRELEEETRRQEEEILALSPLTGAVQG